MPATTCVHDRVPSPILQQADFVLDDPVAFHPTHGVCKANAARGDPTIGCLFRGCQFPSRGVFLGVDEDDPWEEEALEPLILIQGAARW
jgi:hypothetical protein